MNDAFELWSLPWRELQKNLANGFGTDGSRKTHLDSQMSTLESEWRQAYEAGNAAREQLQALSAMPKPNEFTLAKAYDRLERAEGLKARIMAKIEKLENINTRVP
jgi:hypothetical protein